MHEIQTRQRLARTGNARHKTYDVATIITGKLDNLNEPSGGQTKILDIRCCVCDFGNVMAGIQELGRLDDCGNRSVRRLIPDFKIQLWHFRRLLCRGQPFEEPGKTLLIRVMYWPNLALDYMV